MSAVDLTAVQPIAKETYAPMLEIALYKNRPFLGMLKKTPSALGKDYSVPLVIGGNTGLSADFPTAQGAANQPTYTNFAVTWFTYFGVVDVPGAQARTLSGDSASFADLFVISLKMLLEQFSNRLALYLLGGDGTGAFATVSSITATTFIAPRASVFGLEKGDKLWFSQTLTTAIRSATASTVTNINRATGLVTVDAFNGGVANGDFVYHAGDRGTGATPASVLPSGWFSWIPQADPAATAFYGVDRTQDTVRCSGNRVSATGLGNNLNALMIASNFCYENGGSPDAVFVTTATWNATVNAFNGNVRYVKSSSKDSQKVQFSYMGIEIMGQGGPLVLYLDPSLAVDGVAAIAQMDDWELKHSPGDVIGPPKGDMPQWVQRDTSDTFEARLQFTGNLVCHQPGHQATVTNLATT